jgi:UPF0755 protein
MRFLLAFMSLMMMLAVVVAAGGVVWGIKGYHAPGPLTEAKLLVIERGQGVTAIARTLEREGVINNDLLFNVAVRLTGNDKELKAGEYEFAAGLPMAAVLEKLARGDVFQRKITVREGLTSWQVVNLLNDVPDMADDPVTEIPPEGVLLPETYSFVTGDTRSDKIAEMQAAMTKTLDELWAARDETIAVKTKEEALVLASIVEKETGVASERARIAGVFENRLRQGIALQSDPTVIYALTNGKIQEAGVGPLGRRLLRGDLDVDSPYNTYKYPGLPPGPICNPGRDAIAAVLKPEKHDYIYFVADGTGGHVFSATLAEHNSNAAKWRKIRKQQGN